MNPDTLQLTIETAQRRLLDLRRDSGHWVGILDSGGRSEAEYLLLLHLLGRQDDPALTKVMATLRSKQTPDGVWQRSPGGSEDLDVSVTAYLALRVSGVSAESPEMQQAAGFIRDNGGVDATDVFTRALLALFGCCPPHRIPGLFPEMTRLSSRTGNDYRALPVWLRVLALPAAVARTCKDPNSLPEPVHLDELNPQASVRRSSGNGAFIPNLIHRLLALAERLGITPWRQQALQDASEWLHARCAEHDGPGDSAAALIRLLIAMRVLGIEASHPDVERAFRRLNELILQEDDRLDIQPGRIPVWDTAHALASLCASGLDAGGAPALQAAAWLVDQEITSPGEWQDANPHVRPSGWAQTFNGRWYPDIPNTARVLLALQYLREEPDEAEAQGLISQISVQGILDDGQLGDATQRGLAWLLSMQNPDGGWGNWDKMRERSPRPAPPFYDTPDAVDRSTAESTALVLSALSGFGYGAGAPAAQKAVVFLRGSQHRDGYWDTPRCNDPLYITWCVLQAFRSVKEDMTQPDIAKTAEWMRSHQDSDGGWGSPVSTAWAVMGLMALGGGEQQAVTEGIGCLIETQRSDGMWQDETTPAPMEPGLVSYTNDLAPLYFPLMALGMYRQTL